MLDDCLERVTEREETVIASRVIRQPQDASGIELLRDQLVGAMRLDVASAFVTRSGVELFGSAAIPGRFRLVCRAGHGPTEPEAVEIAATELGAEVRLVTGASARRFHPKVYMVAHRTRLAVLSGSGNLTGGGLAHNDEQFDFFTLEPSSQTALSHQQRFNAFWEMGVALDVVRNTPFWKDWHAYSARRKALSEPLNELDSALDLEAPTRPAAKRHPASGSAAWEHAVVLPVIERIIRELASERSEPVTRDAIVQTMLLDPAAKQLVKGAVNARGHPKPLWKEAGSMVDWFSQRFTSGTLACISEFQRHRVSARDPWTGKRREVWAYSLSQQQARSLR